MIWECKVLINGGINYQFNTFFCGLQVNFFQIILAIPLKPLIYKGFF